MIRRLLQFSAAFLAVISLTSAGAEENATEQFMKKFFKGSDCISKKAANGTATDAELAGLLAGCQAMAASEAPAGDAASWKAKTAALVVAVKGLQAHKKNAGPVYKEAANCKACHSVHKP